MPIIEHVGLSVVTLDKLNETCSAKEIIKLLPLYLEDIKNSSAFSCGFGNAITQYHSGKVKHMLKTDFSKKIEKACRETIDILNGPRFKNVHKDLLNVIRHLSPLIIRTWGVNAYTYPAGIAFNNERWNAKMNSDDLQQQIQMHMETLKTYCCMLGISADETDEFCFNKLVIELNNYLCDNCQNMYHKDLLFASNLTRFEEATDKTLNQQYLIKKSWIPQLKFANFVHIINSINSLKTVSCAYNKAISLGLTPLEGYAKVNFVSACGHPIKNHAIIVCSPTKKCEYLHFVVAESQGRCALIKPCNKFEEATMFIAASCNMRDPFFALALSGSRDISQEIFRLAQSLPLYVAGAIAVGLLNVDFNHVSEMYDLSVLDNKEQYDQIKQVRTRNVSESNAIQSLGVISSVGYYRKYKFY